jgi:hypothetical protein
MVAETAWMALAEVQGFQRVYKLLLLGQSISACSVSVAVGYDYDETWIDGAPVMRGTVEAHGLAMVFETASGPFGSFGATITGGTSGATGTVSYLPEANTFILRPVTGTFEVGELISDGTLETAEVASLASSVVISGAPATPVVGQAITGNDSAATGIIASVTALGTAPDPILQFLTLTSASGTFVSTELATVKQLFKYAVAGALNPLQIEHPMHKQQCESVRFRITITPGSASESVRLTNFGLTVGLKKGTHKFSSSKRF